MKFDGNTIVITPSLRRRFVILYNLNYDDLLLKRNAIKMILILTKRI